MKIDTDFDNADDVDVNQDFYHDNDDGTNHTDKKIKSLLRDVMTLILTSIMTFVMMLMLRLIKSLIVRKVLMLNMTLIFRLNIK